MNGRVYLHSSAYPFRVEEVVDVLKHRIAFLHAVKDTDQRISLLERELTALTSVIEDSIREHKPPPVD